MFVYVSLIYSFFVYYHEVLSRWVLIKDYRAFSHASDPSFAAHLKQTD